MCIQLQDINCVVDGNVVDHVHDNLFRVGTGAAGLIAMRIDGGMCGIGVAPRAKIGGNY